MQVDCEATGLPLQIHCHSIT